MTTTEHLQQIKAECELCLEIASMSNSQGRAEAGWRSTIAAIGCIEEFERNGVIPRSWFSMIDNLLAAWPIELLTQ